MEEKPEVIYALLVEYLKGHITPMELADAAWETSEDELRKEMVAIANQKSGLSADEILAMDISDWRPLLSEEERKKYIGYLEKLSMDHLPKHERAVRAVVVSQDPENFMMAGSETHLPAFTTDSTKRTMMTHLDRWLTAREKAAVTGFPVHEDILGLKLEKYLKSPSFVYVCVCAWIYSICFANKSLFHSPSLKLWHLLCYPTCVS